MSRRILLKISGEALLAPDGSPICTSFLDFLAGEVGAVTAKGIQVAIVVGGGNIFRGLQESGKTGIDRATGDYMGMLATVINALALQAAFEKSGLPTRVQSAIEVNKIAEPYIRRRAIRHLEKGRIVIFGAGTGNPFFTTDTAAALRAVEIGADLLIKATKVDGLYDKDPAKHKNAAFIKKATFHEAIEKGYKVMDASALTLCAENELAIKIVNIYTPGNILSATISDEVGSLITV
ncbi:MAG TPA: UMP kinase [bacterium]|nr:UMP kinase [bacterium]